MYLNIMITIVAAVVVYWFVDGIITKLTYKSGKYFAKMTGHAPDFLDSCSQMQEQFRTGNFDQVISLAEKVLAKAPMRNLPFHIKPTHCIIWKNTPRPKKHSSCSKHCQTKTAATAKS